MSKYKVDKSKTISQLNDSELIAMINRLSQEMDLHTLIRRLKRSSGEESSFDKPLIVDNNTPISELYHYGVKGQKWGIRNFQKKDGSRTAAGKKRDRERKSKVSRLSNSELKAINERLRLEDEHARLTQGRKKAESWLKQSLKVAGSQATTEFAKGIFLGGAKMFVKELSPNLAGAAGWNQKSKGDKK